MKISESTNRSGLYELFQDLTGTNTSDYSLAKYIRDTNNALSRFQMLSNFASGKWEVDDSNQTDYPIIKLNVVSGQQSYPISVDGSSVGGQFTSDPNQIWDIARVELADRNGNFSLLDEYDKDQETEALQFQATITGTPNRYDKSFGAVWLDPTPNYDYTQGLVIYIQRSPLFFAIDATTGEPGIPNVFHEYLAIYPAFKYCSAKLLKQAPNLFADVQRIEKDIAKFYAKKNQSDYITMEDISFR